MVLVHGVLDRGSSFDRLRRRLSDFETFAYDRRGYGRSVAVEPAATSFQHHLDDLLGLLDEIGDELGGLAPGGQPPAAVVVGHSYGGNLALAAAQARPELVGSVVVFEPPAPWAAWWPDADAPPGGVLAVARAHGHAAAVDHFLRRFVDDWDRFPDRIKAPRHREGPAMVADLESLRTRPRPYDLSAITVPVVVGWGERSGSHQRRSSTELADELRALGSHFPGRRFDAIEIAGAGHIAHQTHPVEFAGLVRRALSLSLAHNRTAEHVEQTVESAEKVVQK